VYDERELIRGNTPLIVLAVLRDGSQHGYAVLQEINRRTGASLTFKQGTLYPILYALEDDGLIVGQWEHAQGERPRKVYSITPAGVAELEKRLKAWETFTSAMQRVIGGLPDAQPS